MDSDLVQFFIGLLFSAVIWLVVRAHRRSRQQVLRTSLPPQAVLEKYIAILRQMRSANAGYHAQLDYLLQQGLNKEVAEKLIVLIEK